ncbi:SDR family oxidoreductase [candidate division KSB1 bacterium]|nr:MAG: SDR family oxidoreductase [candidate division KSB1 bacterium]
MSDSTSRTALITGASGGIGLELAKLFAQDGWNLVLVARSREKLEVHARALESAHKVSVRIIAQDLSVPGAARNIYDELSAANISIEALVNNAGYGMRGSFAANDYTVEIGMIALNVTALTELTKFFLPPMIAARKGCIMNVASTAGFQPGPFGAVYYATKAYVVSFTEALAEELRGTGVVASVLCPGPTETGWADRAGMSNTPLFKHGVMDAAAVARIGYRGLMRGKVTVIAGLKNLLLMESVRMMPRRLMVRVARMLQE